ncbi:MAG: hypothetical protein FJX40_16125 [Alphaproteobacteria bacterium]|nr:hypothetical protein [Alphaproteobacteria bacterium]
MARREAAGEFAERASADAAAPDGERPPPIDERLKRRGVVFADRASAESMPNRSGELVECVRAHCGMNGVVERAGLRAGEVPLGAGDHRAPPSR